MRPPTPPRTGGMRRASEPDAHAIRRLADAAPEEEKATDAGRNTPGDHAVLLQMSRAERDRLDGIGARSTPPAGGVATQASDGSHTTDRSHELKQPLEAKDHPEGSEAPPEPRRNSTRRSTRSPQVGSGSREPSDDPALADVARRRAELRVRSPPARASTTSPSPPQAPRAGRRHSEPLVRGSKASSPPPSPPQASRQHSPSSLDGGRSMAGSVGAVVKRLGAAGGKLARRHTTDDGKRAHDESQFEKAEVSAHAPFRPPRMPR